LTTLLWMLACAAAPQTVEPPVQAAPTAQPAQEPRPEPEPEPGPEPEPTSSYTAGPPPSGWVDLAQHIPDLRVDARYHTANNFTGAPLPGYGAPAAWLQKAPADALSKVQDSLAEQGLGLIVYDAYRPLRGTLAMVAWAHRTDQVALLDNGYIARRSGHNKGNTIDLSVVTLTTGEPLDMGTPWDTLSEASHTTKASGKALENRLLLRTAMHAQGWKNYYKEWWHYSFDMDGDLTHRDVPYGCWEPAEGTWKAPEGWKEPGYVMPATVEPQPCPDAP
jgi:zinc D-Ala-D-Ala dipeptidase